MSYLLARASVVFSVVSAAVICTILFTPMWASAQSNYYGAYGLYPQGSTRVQAMGGAFVALGDDIASVMYNPAGLAMADDWGLIGGNANIVVNNETDLNADGKLDGIPYYYANYAAALKIGNTAFGLGLSTPYSLDLEFPTSDGSGFTDTRKLGLAVTSVNMPLAYKLTSEWAVGVIFHTETVTEKYNKKSTNPATAPIDLATVKTGSSTSFGVMYRPNPVYGFGLAHSPRKTYEIDSTLNAQTDGVNWFRSVKIPAKTIFGGFYKSSERWIWVADLDYYEPVQDTVYVGSEFMPSFQKVEVDPIQKAVIHGGAEWHYCATNLWDCYFRFGAYNEPPRLKNALSRSHTTLGIEFRFWALTFGLSLDGAQDFINASGGFGISLRPFDIL